MAELFLCFKEIMIRCIRLECVANILKQQVEHVCKNIMNF